MAKKPNRIDWLKYNEINSRLKLALCRGEEKTLSDYEIGEINGILIELDIASKILEEKLDIARNRFMVK